MLPVVVAILPIFLLVFLGWALRAGGMLDEGFWRPAEKLVYWVLFPALIILTLARADLAGLRLAPMAMALVSALVIVAALLALLYPRAGGILGRNGPQFSSVMQGAIRMNTYLCLAIAAALWGNAGLTLAAMAVVVIVPTVNIISVYTLARHAGAIRPTPLAIANQIARNPLILACLVGGILNLFHLPLPGVIITSAEILGSAALPLGLLAVGGGLNFAALKANSRLIGVATLLKLIATPLVTAGTLWVFGVEGMTAAVALLFNASPTAPASYILARQMGGDAPLMAGTITLQTALSMLSLPILLVWLV